MFIPAGDVRVVLKRSSDEEEDARKKKHKSTKEKKKKKEKDVRKVTRTAFKKRISNDDVLKLYLSFC